MGTDSGTVKDEFYTAYSAGLPGNPFILGVELHAHATHQLIRFESGRTEFTLNANTIRNVVVEDHYCYVHYQYGGGYVKRDLAMPLRDVLALLPSDFVRVHRSHVVNLEHIVCINRRNRSIRVILDGDYEVPVSRHRLEEVLPSLRQQIATFGSTRTRNLERGK